MGRPLPVSLPVPGPTTSSCWVAGEAGPRSTHQRCASFEAELRSTPQDEDERSFRLTSPDSGALRRVRILYERSRIPVTIVAACGRMSGTTLRSQARANGWRRRRAPNRADRLAPTPDLPTDRAATGRAMERFIAARVAHFEVEALAGRDRDPERTARTVSHYARALTLVRGYLQEVEKERRADESVRPPARSLTELRDQLRRHLDRLRDEAGDARGLGCAEPHG